MKKITTVSFLFVLGFTLSGCASEVAQAPSEIEATPAVEEAVEVDFSPPTPEALGTTVPAIDETPETTDETSPLSLEEVISSSGVEPVVLRDVANGNASGQAWTALASDQKTYHKVVAKNMPDLVGTDFYEGWIVRNAATGDFISSGKMIPGKAAGDFLLEYTADGDLTDYKKVVITLEPDDGDPAPAAHIIEN